ncbi:hypothetical protein OHA38_43770 (plasmid) [Streptomyces sp. NBC_01732]|nr:hypothetical protein OHA38_43770 [Streptomyces sp. NBC_01732]
MPRSAARTWSAARTEAGLGELTAQWLEGALATLAGELNLLRIRF